MLLGSLALVVQDHFTSLRPDECSSVIFEVCFDFCCRRIVDDGVKENGFSIITENRTYHVIAENTNDWK